MGTHEYVMLISILFCCLIRIECADTHFELHPFDGYYNNLIHPDWGTVDGHLLRKSPAAYSDGVYQPSGKDRPNPFAISKAAHEGIPGLGSLRGRTAFMVYFGQQVVEEILDAQRPGCPREFFNIPLDDSASHLNPDHAKGLEMPLFRNRYDQNTGYSPNNPRQQINEITPYIDGTLFYGPGKAWTDAIRELSEVKKGRLKSLDINAPINQSFPALNDINLPMANPPPPREHTLKPVDRFWRLGNPRGNENPFLLTFGVLWFRYHNYVADEICRQNGNLTDEQVFNLARKKVIATHQKIVMYDWLPTWLNSKRNGTSFEMPKYNTNDPNNSYDPNVHPGITVEFQSAAMRFGHTLVTPGTWIRSKNTTDGKCNFLPLNLEIPGQPNKAHALRLCNSFWNPQEFLSATPDSFDDMIRGLASTLSEREDNIVVPDLRKNVFGPLEFSRRDLMAVNVQRGRETGLPDYNTVREAYKLHRINTWEEINTYNVSDDEDLIDNANSLYPDGCYMCGPIQRVKAVYGNTPSPDKLDLFTGGMLETTPDGPGETFKTIILEQFLRIRHGDRFWFENTNNGLFNETEIDEIHNITIKNIVLMVTRISEDDINVNPFSFDETTDPCPQPSQLRADTGDTYNGTDEIIIENCTRVEFYDYFSGSEYSYALSFLAIGLFIPATIGVMILMANSRQKKIVAIRRRETRKRRSEDPNIQHAIEWVGPKDGERNVKVEFDNTRKKIHVKDRRGKPLRMIDLRFVDNAHVRLADNLLSVRVPGDIDLILRFADVSFRDDFMRAFTAFLEKINVRLDRHEMVESMILKDATTKGQRQKLLDQFIRVVCLQAFKQEDVGPDVKSLDSETANNISKIQLTKTEFAESLGLKPTSMFVRNMFRLVDKQKKGLVGFQQFMELFMIIAKGNAGDKVQMLFNMYDIRGTGELTPKDFTKLIKSMLELSDSKLEDAELDTLMGTLYQQAGLKNGQNMSLAAFKKVFASDEYERVLENATLQLQGQSHSLTESITERRKTFIESFNAGDEVERKGPPTLQRSKSRIRIGAKSRKQPTTKTQKHLYSFTKYVENYRREIFWLTLYSLVSVGIFLERALYYSFEREHVGLRRLAGYGVTVTRGAASGMMWTYSCLLITMSRNTITFLRETFLHRFIPFDRAHDFHKLIAALAMVFTVTHVIGHAINFYHIATWSSQDLNCVFREYFRSSDVLTSFHYWAWTTITGLTGIVLTLIVIVMYVFAIPFARRNLFKAFWLTHGLYVFLYIFMILHGSGRLVQAPLTQNYLIGPLVIFVIDKLVSISRKKVEISVKKAELLPSDVLGLTFKRPLNFEYKSGQWVRIACLELGSSEYHPFTLTSAPHEENLSLHIRAVGPWTMNMRKTYDINNRNLETFPKIYIDGPFGEGHQDWYRYKVAVLVGGGIGVTPFASILKDIVFKSRTPGVRFPCKKVYFLWVTRTQKQFEWLTDIIHEVENNDPDQLVDVHIFITQFQQKFDLRTAMLYICERKFQKIKGKSLFTGLRAKTHFGRPHFEDFLTSIHEEHPKVQQVGVFSCGPPPMTLNVDRACASMNKVENFPTYTHHFENF